MASLMRNSLPLRCGARNVRAARSRLLAVGLVVCFAAVGWKATSIPGDRSIGSTAFLGGKRSIFLRGPLLRFQGYELRQVQAFPFLAIYKVPPRPLSSLSISASADGALDDFGGFPFSTKNEGRLALGIARPTSGKFVLSVADPPSQLELEQVLGVDYAQEVPGIGEVAGKLKSSGDWKVGLAREVNALGKLRGSIDSQLDWSLDLDKNYPSYMGLTPSVSYGATPDGMHAQLKLDGKLHPRAAGSYSVRNEPGIYSIGELAHAGSLALSSDSGRHALEVKGVYNERDSGGSPRGSVKYTANGRSASLDALVDSEQFRLALRGKPAEVSAAIAREENEGGNRPVDVELKLARGVKVSALAHLLDGKPRLRLSAGV